MTNQEAIDKMEFCKRAYQRMIDENSQEGVFVGKGFEGKWKADTPLYKVYEDMRDACDMAIKALSQEPNKEAYNQGYEDGYLAGQKNIAERFEGLIKSGISTDTPDDIKYVIGLLNNLPPVKPKEPCKDAISRQATIEAFQMFRGYEANRTNAEWVDRIETIVKKLPSVMQEPKTGHWIMTGDYLTTAYSSIDYVKCSCCNEYSLEEGDYCPNCGCRMVEPQESEVQE